MIEYAVQYAVDVANNNYHGYSQTRRGKQDKDCSSLVLDALKAAGYDTGTATYTGNMLKPLLSAGFINVTKEIDLKTCKGLKRGDILLRPKTATKGGHTAFYIGTGNIVQAAADHDGKTGDSSGQEIRIQKYYNSPFTYVLRDLESTLTVGMLVKISGIGYPTSYAEGQGKLITGKGKIVNIYDESRKCPYAINYTDTTKNWTDRFFPKTAISIL